jgi:hypothetical protein
MNSQVFGIILMASFMKKRRNLLNSSVLKSILPALLLLLIYSFFFLKDMNLVSLAIASVANIFGSIFWLKNREAQQHFGLFPFHIIFNLCLLILFFFVGCIFLFEDFRSFIESEILNVIFFAFGNFNKHMCC